MDRVPVKSSHIVSMGWEKINGRPCLEVEFKNGHIFRYFDVARHHYLTMTHAPEGMSVGNYFNTYVKLKHEVQRVYLTSDPASLNTEETVGEHTFVMSNTISTGVAKSQQTTATSIDSPTSLGEFPQPKWLDKLDANEKSQVEYSRVYKNGNYFGSLNHFQMLLVAKLADLLDEAEGSKP